MQENAGFLEAIRTEPWDDVPRLVYADWLDEHGDPERAEIIRVQCELARLPADDDRVSDLQAREYRLLSRHLATWREGHGNARFCRGFLEQLECCRPEEFIKSGPQFFARHPVRDVEIGSQEEPGWGPLVADCPHLRQVETLRLTQQRSHFTDFSDFLAILSSPHLTNLTALDASGGHCYGDRVLLDLLGVPVTPLFGQLDESMLPSLHALRRLSLNEMALTDEGLVALAKSPLANTLTHLDLSDNSGLYTNSDGIAAGITADGIRALIDSPLWARLVELNLGGLQFPNGAVVRLLIDALPRSSISRLGLRGFLHRDVCRLDVAEILAGATSWGKLEALDLSWCNLNGQGLWRLLECPHLLGLKWLNLSRNNLIQNDVDLLAKSRFLTNLTALRLKDHSLFDNALRALAHSPYLNRLTYLNVGDSPIKDAGVAAFAQSPNAARLRIWVLPGYLFSGVFSILYSIPTSFFTRFLR